VSRAPVVTETARLLRQRIEMGATDVVLDGLTRAEALAILHAARGREGPATSSASAGPAHRAVASGHGDARASSEIAEASTATPSPTLGRPEPAGAAADASPPGAATLPVLPDEYEALRDLALGCTRCALSRTRTQVVFSDGPPDARLMVVGEAPGANEDETGLPFVGAAGKYLDLLLATVGLSRRDSVYIANVLKCRPPGNRNPTELEIETCSPYLRKQIDLVRPRALLAVGSFSGKLLTGQGKTSLGRLRGAVHGYHGVPLVVTYHPAALLRNPRWTRLFWDDLQLLREVLDSA
jgi:DNA polymerase